MYVLLIGALLFAVGGIYNVIDGNFSEAIAGFSIAISMVITRYFFENEKRKADQFIQWLYDKQSQFTNGDEVIYKGIRMNMETTITQYEATISFLLITYKAPSRYYVKGYHYTPILSLFHSLISFLLGWWGLPWGPIYTIKSIFKNLSGGYSITVGKLLEANNASTFEDQLINMDRKQLTSY